METRLAQAIHNHSVAESEAKKKFFACLIINSQIHNTMKTIKLTLIQGDNTPLVFTRTIDTENISEVSGTIVANVLSLYTKSRKYKMNIGFSFARKFDILLTVDGVETSFNKMTSQETVRFGITLTPQSVGRFADFLNELVIDAMTLKSVMIYDLDEVKEEFAVLN